MYEIKMHEFYFLGPPSTVIANNKCRARGREGGVEREVWSKKGRGVLREGLEGVSGV
jgi:hypothetical protein